MSDKSEDYDDGYRDGYEEGKEEGYEEGKEEGYEEGYFVGEGGEGNTISAQIRDKMIILNEIYGSPAFRDFLFTEFEDVFNVKIQPK